MLTIARDLFMGPGAVIIQIALLAIGGWLMMYITSALGKGQLTNLINLAVLFVAFTLAIGTIWAALTKVAQVLGIG